MKDKDCIFCKIANGEIPASQFMKMRIFGLFWILVRHLRGMR